MKNFFTKEARLELESPLYYLTSWNYPIMVIILFVKSFAKLQA